MHRCWAKIQVVRKCIQLHALYRAAAAVAVALRGGRYGQPLHGSKQNLILEGHLTLASATGLYPSGELME